MHLSDTQIQEYERSGYLLMPGVFSRAEIDVLKAQLPALFQTDGPSRIMEKDGGAIRSVYGSHVTNEVCRQLTCHPRLLLPARRLLQSPVYVHQFKINAKAAFGGDQWEWHQDYIFWRDEDGMPTDRVVNVAVYLDDVTDFNGPILLLPGSHHEGVIDAAARRALAAPAEGAPPAWMSHLTTGLKYALDVDTVRALVSRWDIRSPTAAAGSVLFFHPNVVHASSQNMSPFDRAVAMVTFNSTENTPPPSAHPRPAFLAGRDFRPLAPVADDVFASAVESPAGR